MNGKLLPSACLLANNLEAFTKFFRLLFEGAIVESLNRPVRHNIIRISDDAVIVLVLKSSCSSSQLNYFSVISSRQLFIAVKDVVKIQRSASQAHAQVSETSLDESNPEGDFIVFEGPENTIFHVISEARSIRLGVHELIMNSPQLYEDEREDQSAHQQPQQNRRPPSKPKQPLKKRIASPLIPTLDCSILSNMSRSYIPCPANAREETPFETEFFSGVALLVVRTKPPDEHYASFFGGGKK
jgi:hypothetical protein